MGMCIPSRRLRAVVALNVLMCYLGGDEGQRTSYQSQSELDDGIKTFAVFQSKRGLGARARLGGEQLGMRKDGVADI